MARYIAVHHVAYGHGEEGKLQRAETAPGELLHPAAHVDDLKQLLKSGAIKPHTEGQQQDDQHAAAAPKKGKE